MKTVLRYNTAGETAGFTLLETLIALALMGVTLAALGTITAQWMPNWNHGMHRLQREEQLTLGLDRLAADLSGAEFVSVGHETSLPYFDGSARSVSFVRTAVGPNAGSALEVIRIAEAHSEQGTAVVRMQAAFAIGRDYRDQSAFTNPVVLVRAPYRIIFSYAGADRAWRATWQWQARLPAAIKLDVHEAGHQKTHSASTAIRPHVAVPQSCISAKSFDECLRSLQPQNGSTRS